MISLRLFNGSRYCLLVLLFSIQCVSGWILPLNSHQPLPPNTAERGFASASFFTGFVHSSTVNINVHGDELRMNRTGPLLVVQFSEGCVMPGASSSSTSNATSKQLTSMIPPETTGTIALVDMAEAHRAGCCSMTAVLDWIPRISDALHTRYGVPAINAAIFSNPAIRAMDTHNTPCIDSPLVTLYDKYWRVLPSRFYCMLVSQQTMAWLESQITWTVSSLNQEVHPVLPLVVYIQHQLGTWTNEIVRTSTGSKLHVSRILASGIAAAIFTVQLAMAITCLIKSVHSRGAASESHKVAWISILVLCVAASLKLALISPLRLHSNAVLFISDMLDVAPSLAMILLSYQWCLLHVDVDADADCRFRRLSTMSKLVAVTLFAIRLAGCLLIYVAKWTIATKNAFSLVFSIVLFVYNVAALLCMVSHFVCHVDVDGITARCIGAGISILGWTVILGLSSTSLLYTASFTACWMALDLCFTLCSCVMVSIAITRIHHHLQLHPLYLSHQRRSQSKSSTISDSPRSTAKKDCEVWPLDS